jgi:hypothetical protein
LLFLPPYSPFLNPIEYAFNALKTAVAQERFTNRGELRAVVEEKLKSINPEAAKGFYQQAAKYYKMCGLGLPFIGKPLDPQIPHAEEPPQILLEG